MLLWYAVGQYPYENDDMGRVQKREHLTRTEPRQGREPREYPQGEPHRLQLVHHMGPVLQYHQQMQHRHQVCTLSGCQGPELQRQ